MSSMTKLMKASKLTLTGHGLPEIFSLPRDPKFWVGQNRAPATVHTMIRARDDLSAINAWLAEFTIKPTTHSNYLKEARRLVLWAVANKGMPISELTHEDLVEYREFLLNPFPATTWINRTKRPFGHPEWRPFNGPLSIASARQAMVIINVMFSWLVQAGYLKGNPLCLMKPRKIKDKRGVTRYLDKPTIVYLLDHIEQMPEDTDEQKAEKARRRWIIVVFYQTAMRISEVAINKMGQVRRSKDDQGNDIWGLDVLGKGDKWRPIPISDEFLDECALYRESIGLSGRPLPGDETPLLCSSRYALGSRIRRPLSRQHIHKLLKGILNDVKKEMIANGDTYAVAQLNKASAHWFRHSAATHLVDSGVDMAKTRDYMGHEDISTTGQYSHTEFAKMHKEVTETLAVPKKKPRD